MTAAADAAVEADRRRLPLDRDIASLVRSAGWDLLGLNTGYMRGPRPFTFMYEGQARAGAAP